MAFPFTPHAHSAQLEPPGLVTPHVTTLPHTLRVTTLVPRVLPLHVSRLPHPRCRIPSPVPSRTTSPHTAFPSPRVEAAVPASASATWRRSRLRVSVCCALLTRLRAGTPVPPRVHNASAPFCRALACPSRPVSASPLRPLCSADSDSASAMPRRPATTPLPRVHAHPVSHPCGIRAVCPHLCPSPLPPTLPRPDRGRSPRPWPLPRYSTLPHPSRPTSILQQLPLALPTARSPSPTSCCPPFPVHPPLQRVVSPPHTHTLRPAALHRASLLRVATLGCPAHRIPVSAAGSRTAFSLSLPPLPTPSPLEIHTPYACSVNTIVLILFSDTPAQPNSPIASRRVCSWSGL
ncbi:hypothetical protein B0H14DRAFT_3863229 [Mycena olivaceomarginata]|nr:hypothetical protein B0H14DRAFT_3863229 [Mycena olivaceomarginata]